MDGSKFVQGTCQQMCPDKEIQMREKEGLVHRFETLAGTETEKRPRADRRKMVKSFSRSAAGHNMALAENLRPPEVLLQTVDYLLHDIITIEYCEWVKVYDFIMDRVRSVRQDMVIQNLQRPYCISLLQPIVRFYAYSSYRLCTEHISHYDPVINAQHLQECLKRLLVFYDECDDLQHKYTRLLKKSSEIGEYSSLFSERPLMESIYLLLNLGNADAINRILNLDKKWRHGTVKYCLEISLSMRRGNWVRTCRMISDLPSLLCAVACLHLGEIRRQAFYKMSFAYNSKLLTLPLEIIKTILLYNSKEEVMSDLKYYKVSFDENDETVNFVKGSFDVNKETVPPRHCKFVDEKLEEKSLTSLVLHEMTTTLLETSSPVWVYKLFPENTNQGLNQQAICPKEVKDSGDNWINRAYFGTNKIMANQNACVCKAVESKYAEEKCPSLKSQMSNKGSIQKPPSYGAVGAGSIHGSAGGPGTAQIGGPGVGQVSSMRGESGPPSHSGGFACCMLGKLREPIANYQEQRGIDTDTEHSFIGLMTALFQATYHTILSIVTMLVNLMPLVDGFLFLVRFMLDKSLDICMTESTKEKVLKIIVFLAESVVIFLVVFFIICLVVVPIWHLIAYIFGKVWHVFVK